jgi:hypothetical protein
MNLFVEFDSVTQTGNGLLCEGSIPTEKMSIAAESDPPLREMAAEEKVGRLRGCSVVDGVLRVAAEIWNRIAVAKAVERVYRGLLLVCVPSGDGEVAIEHAALVDHPDALGKRSGAAPPMALYTDGVTKMSLPNPGRNGGAPQNPYARIEVGGINKGADERAIDLLKYHRRLATPTKPTPVDDKAFFAWLHNRGA